jgi:hypothetical protein
VEIDYLAERIFHLDITFTVKLSSIFKLTSKPCKIAKISETFSETSLRFNSNKIKFKNLRISDIYLWFTNNYKIVCIIYRKRENTIRLKYYFVEEDFTNASTVEYLGEREMLVDCKLGQRTFFSLEKNK